MISTRDRKNLARRYTSNVIDYVVFSLLAVLVVFWTGELHVPEIYQVAGPKTILVPLVWIIYFPVCEALFGQTIGKRIFRLHVIDRNGKRPSLRQALLRRLFDVPELFLAGLPALASIRKSERNQRLGDVVADTSVVRTDIVCLHCGAHLVLTPKEITRDSFVCPRCNQVN